MGVSVVTTDSFYAMIEGYGLTAKDMTILKGRAHLDIIRPLIEGMAVACILPGSIPIAAATELHTMRNADILSLDEIASYIAKAKSVLSTIA